MEHYCLWTPLNLCIKSKVTAVRSVFLKLSPLVLCGRTELSTAQAGGRGSGGL